MAITVVQSLGGQLTAVDPVTVDLGTTAVTAGNLMLFVVGMHTTSPTVTGITDTLGSTWTQKTTLLITGEAYWEVWTAPVPSTGLNDLTVDCSAAPAGGNGFMFLELSGVSSFDVGPNNTNAYTAAADPVALATLTTTRPGIIVTSAHNDSNYSTTTASLGGGFTVITRQSRVMIGYRNSTGGESVSPTATFDSGGSETGESMTLALYTSDPLTGGVYTITGGALTSLTVTGSGLKIFIAGEDQAGYIQTPSGNQRRTVNLHYNLASNWTATFPIFDTDSTAAAVRPTLDQAVLITYQGQIIHKGHIVTVRDRPWASSASGVVTDVTSHANRIATDQIEVTQTYAADYTLKQVVTHLFDFYINPYFSGYVLDPAMLDGPVMGETVTFGAVRLQDAFNRLTDLTGWIVRITPNDVIEAFEVGTKSAAYALTAANGLAEILGSYGAVVTWEQTRTNFVNRVHLKYGEGLQERTQTFAAATAGQTSWTLDVTGSGAALRTYITVDGVAIGIGIWGFDSEIWQWQASTNSIRRTPGASGGQVVSVTYDAQYPATVTVSDAASIAAVGLFERTFTAPDVFDPDEATNLATGYLRVNSSSPKTVTVSTRQYPMPLPGDVINLAFANRMVTDANYLITQVSAQDVLNAQLIFQLTCVSGTEAKRSWTDILRKKLGGDR